MVLEQGLFKMDRSFPSKILLFGEYSVIKNLTKALCIAYPFYEGRLSFPEKKKEVPDRELKAFFTYLKFLEQSGRSPVKMDLDSFETDIAQGMIFDSTIPRGFGVGSSGALTAAVYDRYVEREFRENNILKLKEIFSIFESHFHGTGSGLDPFGELFGKEHFHQWLW